MKYKIGDILKIKNSDIETMITRIDKGDNTYYLSNCWESEHYLDENFELLTPHEDVNENAKTVHIDVKDVNEYKPWRAEFGDRYYYVEDSGTIDDDYDDCWEEDNYRYNTGNYFGTKVEAEHYKEYLLAKQTLKNDAKGFVPNWNNGFEAKWQVYLNGLLKTDHNYNAKDVNLAFATRKDAQASINKHEKEWRIIFNWENGKR